MGNASERRKERVSSLLRSTLDEIIREELSDPRLGIFSLTEVVLARDLTSAEVRVATVGGPEASAVSCAVLNRAAPLLWNRLRRETDLRSVPRLRFVPDISGIFDDEIHQLLQTVVIPAAPDSEPEDGVEEGAPSAN